MCIVSKTVLPRNSQSMTGCLWWCVETKSAAPALKKVGIQNSVKHFQCFGTQIPCACDSQVYVVSKHHLIDLTGIHVRILCTSGGNSVLWPCSVFGANTNLKLFLMNSERSECVVKDRFCGGRLFQWVSLYSVFYWKDLFSLPLKWLLYRLTWRSQGSWHQPQLQGFHHRFPDQIYSSQRQKLWVEWERHEAGWLNAAFRRTWLKMNLHLTIGEYNCSDNNPAEKLLVNSIRHVSHTEWPFI